MFSTHMGDAIFVLNMKSNIETAKMYLVDCSGGGLDGRFVGD